MTLLKLVLIASLITDLDGQALLLTILRGEVVRALCDAALGHFVQHLQFVEELALVANQGLLLIHLYPQFRELGIHLLFLSLKGRLQIALLVFFHLDHSLLSLHMHTKQFCLLVEGLLLLTQLIKRRKQAFNAALTRFS